MWQQLPEKTHDLLITELAAILCCNSKTTGQVYLLYNLSFPLDRVTFVLFLLRSRFLIRLLSTAHHHHHSQKGSGRRGWRSAEIQGHRGLG